MERQRVCARPRGVRERSCRKEFYARRKKRTRFRADIKRMGLRRVGPGARMKGVGDR